MSAAGASATVVAAAVPDTTTLAGRLFPMLDLPADSFRVDVADPLTSLLGAVGGAGSSRGQPVLLGTQAGSTDLPPTLAISAGQVSRRGAFADATEVEAMCGGSVDPSVFPAVNRGLLPLPASDSWSPTFISAEPLSAMLAKIQPARVAVLLRADYQPNAFRFFDGSLTFNYVTDPPVIGPGSRGGEIQHKGGGVGPSGQAAATITSPVAESKISDPRGGFRSSALRTRSYSFQHPATKGHFIRKGMKIGITKDGVHMPMRAATNWQEINRTLGCHILPARPH